jgi:hypothetical protein
MHLLISKKIKMARFTVSISRNSFQALRSLRRWA